MRLPTLCIRPPGVYRFMHLSSFTSLFHKSCLFLCLLCLFLSLDPLLQPLAVNKEIITCRPSATCVCVFICASTPPALQSNRLQITVNGCGSKVFKYFAASNELQLNLKERKMGGWWRIEVVEQRGKGKEEGSTHRDEREEKYHCFIY